jgi:hypothetical protein
MNSDNLFYILIYLCFFLLICGKKNTIEHSNGSKIDKVNIGTWDLISEENCKCEEGGENVTCDKLYIKHNDGQKILLKELIINKQK